MADHAILAPLVIAKGADGADVYLYQGAPFPSGLRTGELERLTNAGLVATVEEVVVVPQGAPDDTWNVKQIDAFAAVHDIDLTSVSKKAEKLELVAAHSGA